MSNNTIKFLLLASMVLNLTILGTVGYRYHQRSTYWTSPFGHRMPRDRFLFEELALEPQQVETMKKRAIQFRADLDRQRAEVARMKKDLIGLMRRDIPDLPAIRSQIAGINAKQEEMQQQVATHMLEEKALLNKEQQQHFFDLIEDAMNKGSQTGCPSAD